jgi:DNA ligase D-like protein (predicted ligase)
VVRRSGAQAASLSAHRRAQFAIRRVLDVVESPAPDFGGEQQFDFFRVGSFGRIFDLMERTVREHRIDFTAPMECAPVGRIPEGAGWVYELKLDGFRGQAVHDRGGIHLYSRNGKDFTRRFPRLLSALEAAMPAGTALDGELVAFNLKGQPSFVAMQDADSDSHIVFFVFDVLWSRGKDTKMLPLSERLSLLGSAFTPSDLVQRAEHFTGQLQRFAAAVREIGGEGVIAKRLSSRYEPGRRSGSWTKTRFNVGQEFVIGGFTPGSHGIDALVVGFYEDRKLRYAARVRAGLLPATRRDLYARLKGLIIQACPFSNLPEAQAGRWGQGLTIAKMRECIWVRPKLVANFEFLEWTDTSHVRHIKFAGLRADKDSRTVVRE